MSEPLKTPTPRIDPDTGETVLKAESPEALLRMVPALAHLDPVDSVVLVLFAGRRTAGGLRIDLPRTGEPLLLARWAAHVVGLACKVAGVTGLIPVVYTPETFAPSGRIPRADVLRAVTARAEQAGLVVKGQYCVAADGWGSPDDPDLPRGGRGLADIEPLPIDAYGGGERLDAVPEYPETSEAADDRFWEAVERWWCTVGGPSGADGRPLHGVELRRPGSAFTAVRRHEGSAFHRMRFGQETGAAVDLIEAALAPHDHDPDRPCPCLALLYCFSRRDGLSGLVLAQVGWGSAVARRCWRATTAVTVRRKDPLGPLLGGTTTERPDPARLRRAIELLVTIGGHVAPDSRAGVDAMLAWLHWSLGACTVAGRLARRALDVDGEATLPAAVLRLAGGGLPEWAYGEPDVRIPA